MAIELLGVIAGGGIGLLGGLGGVLLGHVLARKRESANRSIDGLRLVVQEINRFSRIALFFEQQINIAMREEVSPSACATRLIAVPDWQKATHELQEAHWRFPCMAYLPEAKEDFAALDRLIGYVMDPYVRTPNDVHDRTSEQAWEEMKQRMVRIQELVEARLARLL
ncbi:hypothetical protein [Hydrogenophaga sp. OTU3427]|uniref:hypothetical protein n=1 Tax=Hydrogenophaga sp. OTU3427 TaxID=3043856 RepID=UPI00313AFECD